MLRCPACSAVFDLAEHPSGKCPECGVMVQQAAKRSVSQTKNDIEANDSRATVEHSGSSIDIEMIDENKPIPKDPENVLDDSIGTVELPSTGIGTGKGGTVGNVGDHTVDFASLDDVRKTQPVRTDQTIEFGSSIGDGPDSSSSVLEQSISLNWSGTHVEDAPQRQTIRQDEGSRIGYRSQLPVKPRSLRPRDSGPQKMVMPSDAPDYELLDMIGEGGMGVVYAAHQSSIARTVAVKMLKPNAKVSEEHRDKFISEAVVTGELDHPNIVPIYDLGANDEGALFYSMKRVKGTPWEDVLKEKSLDENLNILMRVADAVAFAHANGVVHRDLKPENVMLGDFGEVLVMDWGLARFTEEFPSSGSIYQTNTLGGTPAYMSPEMARGPVDDIDERSDIYLLGAILYEIIGGRAPHSGSNVMQCLMAAAENRIDPVDFNGELLDIAMHAMATDRESRYATVLEFQQAVREFQSHSESLLLTAAADRHLASAEESGDYQQYARALYGFQESLTLWEGNTQARQKLVAAELTYARAALTGGDLDLAESLLEPDREEHKELREQVHRAQATRRARRQIMRRMQWLVAGLGITLLALGVWSYIAISNGKQIAETERDRANENERIAKENEKVAIEAKDAADLARKAETAAKDEAIRNADLAEQRAEEARQARIVAEEAKDKAISEEQKAIAAKEAEEYEAYVAKIGLASAKVTENAYGFAQELLDECPPERRNWEWGRLNYLCQLAASVTKEAGQIHAAAYSPDGKQIATGNFAGGLVVRDSQSREVAFSVKLGQYVHTLGYSPNGKLIAAGTNDGKVHVLSATDGEVLRTIDAHKDGVLAVAFSPAGDELISTSYDNEAKVWDAKTGAAKQTLMGHNWWVWSVDYAPAGDRIVTTSQDGTAIVWRRAADGTFATEGQFRGHDGPVYDATFSPSGKLVASGGYDGRICLWKPDELSTIDLAQQVEGQAGSTLNYRVLSGHEAAVRSVAFDANGARLLSGGHDNVLWLWDVKSAKPIKTLRGHAGRVEAVAFSPDGKRALSGGQDSQLREWNIADYNESRVLRGRVLAGHYDAVLAAKFLPDGSGVITASRDRTAQLYDTATGTPLRRFEEGHDFLATSGVFFDDGRRLATGAGDNSVRLWDVQTGGQILVLRGTGRTGALAVAPGGSWLATGGAAGRVQLFDSATGAQLTSLDEHEVEVTAATIDPTGTLLATGDERGDIVLWSVAEGGKSAQFIARLEGHSRTITSLDFTDGGKKLISSSGDRSCGQWDVATKSEDIKLVLKHPEWVGSVDVSPDGKLAVTTCDDGKVRLWSLAEPKVVATASLKGEVINSAKFSPGGNEILVTSWAARQVWTWDGKQDITLDTTPAAIDIASTGGLLWAAEYTADGQRILTVGGNDARLWSTQGEQAETVLRFSPHGAVAAIDASPDGKLLATGSWDTTVKLWDIETGRVMRKLVGGHQGYITDVAFSPNGKTLASSDEAGRVQFWNVESGDRLDDRSIELDTAVNAIGFSPDGKLLAIALGDGTASLYSTDSGDVASKLRGHQFGLLAVAFSRDGKLIVTAGEDNVAIVHSLDSGEAVKLQGHTSSVTGVAFSRDGSRVLTASQDGTAKLWDAANGQEILTLGGHTRELTDVDFSPNGTTILSASRDGTSILWPATAWEAEAPATDAP